jgi:hypothetical protein
VRRGRRLHHAAQHARVQGEVERPKVVVAERPQLIVRLELECALQLGHVAVLAVVVGEGELAGHVKFEMLTVTPVVDSVLGQDAVPVPVARLGVLHGLGGERTNHLPGAPDVVRRRRIEVDARVAKQCTKPAECVVAQHGRQHSWIRTV